jgi:hypothetical protein
VCKPFVMFALFWPFRVQYIVLSQLKCKKQVKQRLHNESMCTLAWNPEYVCEAQEKGVVSAQSGDLRRSSCDLPPSSLTHGSHMIDVRQSDNISHIDMGDMGNDHIDTVIFHIFSPYPISISRMTISLW